MNSGRREFLERAAVGALAFGAFPEARGISSERSRATAARQGVEEWDLSWTTRLRGKYKAVFDCAEIEGGAGVWRASVWEKQYQSVLAVPEADLSAVVVLRHKAIVLAMQQEFWDRYGIGKAKGVLHPLTEKPTDRNPVLLSSADGMPAELDSASLPSFIARGGVALACNLAFAECVGMVKRKEKLDDAAARQRAIASLVPGVLLQPSGVFAALHAQDAGCSYLRAS